VKADSLRKTRVLCKKISEIAAQNAANSGIELVYLFGSRTKGQAREKSDIDIAVYLSPEEQKRFSRLKLILVEIFTDGLVSDNVDLLILNQATPSIAFEVVKHGILCFKSGDLTRILVEKEVMLRYYDTQHLRNVAQKYFAERLEKTGEN
jgi:predicted nucleotidyltransferase